MAVLVVLLLMPIGHIIMSFITSRYDLSTQMLSAGILGFIGFLLVILFNRSENEVKSSLIGLLAGVLIWTGWVEFSFVYFADRLSVQPLMEGGEIVTRPEYLVMISSAGLVFTILTTIILNYATNCNFFAWVQRLLGTPRVGVKRKNYVALTAYETVMILWFFYILLLIAYDQHLFGDRHIFTYMIFFGSLLWSAFLFRNLYHLRHFGKSVRYAIPTVIIFWNCVEILGRWNYFREFWVEPTHFWLESILILLVFAILFVYSYFANKRKKDLKY